MKLHINTLKRYIFSWLLRNQQWWNKRHIQAIIIASLTASFCYLVVQICYHRQITQSLDYHASELEKKGLELRYSSVKIRGIKDIDVRNVEIFTRRASYLISVDEISLSPSISTLIKQFVGISSNPAVTIQLHHGTIKIVQPMVARFSDHGQKSRRANPALTLYFSDGNIVLNPDGMRLQVKHVAAYRNDFKDALWLLNTEYIYHKAYDASYFLTRIVDDYGGSALAHGTRHHSTHNHAIKVVFDRLDLSTINEVLGLSSQPLHGSFKGKIGARYDANKDTYELIYEAEAHNISGSNQALSASPISIQNIVAHGIAEFYPRHNQLEVRTSSLEINNLGPITVHGTARAADRGWHYNVSATIPEDAIQQYFSNLPHAILGQLKHAQLSGSWGMNVKSSGYTAVPESIKLDVAIENRIVSANLPTYIPIEQLAQSGRIPLDSARHSSKYIGQNPWVSLSQLPDYVPQSLLAAEDSGYFAHHGIDWDAIRNAFASNLSRGEIVMGGSTISQQLVKNLFLTHERTMARKIQEAILTWKVESVLTKERILEIYLNIVEWGPKVYGIAAASNYYFDKSPGELTPDEATLLMAILPAPRVFGTRIKEGFLSECRQQKMLQILIELRYLGFIDWPSYQYYRKRVNHGKIGVLRLLPCPLTTQGALSRDCLS